MFASRSQSSIASCSNASGNVRRACTSTAVHPPARRTSPNPRSSPSSMQFVIDERRRHATEVRDQDAPVSACRRARRRSSACTRTAAPSEASTHVRPQAESSSSVPLHAWPSGHALRVRTDTSPTRCRACTQRAQCNILRAHLEPPRSADDRATVHRRDNAVGFDRRADGSPSSRLSARSRCTRSRSRAAARRRSRRTRRR